MFVVITLVLQLNKFQELQKNLFFCISFFLQKTDNLAKKMQGSVFLMNQRPHLIWKKKKKTSKTLLNIRLYQAQKNLFGLLIIY